MKSRIALAALLVSVFGVSDLAGQRVTDAEQQVLTTDSQRTEALLSGNAVSLQLIYADDYTLITPAGVIQTKADQIMDLSSGRLRYISIEVSERTVRVYGDVAIILSREKTNIIRGDQQVGGDIRVTRTYRKFGDQWRVVATHASIIQ